MNVHVEFHEMPTETCHWCGRVAPSGEMQATPFTEMGGRVLRTACINVMACTVRKRHRKVPK